MSDETASNTQDPIASPSQLKQDSVFMERYMSGDRDAVDQMQTAIQSDLGESKNTPETTPDLKPSDYVINFGYEVNHSLSTEELAAVNTEAGDIAASVGCPKEMVQPFYDRITQCAKEYGRDPEINAEDRRESLIADLIGQWGDQYENRMGKVVEVLNDHPEIDELLYASGAWADPWTISTLSRVIEQEL